MDFTLKRLNHGKKIKIKIMIIIMKEKLKQNKTI